MELTIKEAHLGTVLVRGWGEVEWDKVVTDPTLLILVAVSPTMEVFMEAMIEARTGIRGSGRHPDRDRGTTIEKTEVGET